MGDFFSSAESLFQNLEAPEASADKKRTSSEAFRSSEEPPTKKRMLSETTENESLPRSNASNAANSASEVTNDSNNYYGGLSSDTADVEQSAIPEEKKKGQSGPNLFKDVKNNAATAEELMEERKKCQHQMCVPKGWSGDKWDDNAPPAAQPAKHYSFNLDPFQKVSIACLERNESVLVSAHTSAGKTVVAQYAIAMALRDKQRVVYTSPIKALSNQKFRDLTEEFQDVGLMTGDITINPEASCLVMTTEILRSMLYRGSEILREVGWVIFDEIHYMRDKERGVVWEETLILLPDKIRFVFLSATIPNAKEFAEWIAQLHNQPCHVVYTDFRPIPLQHYLYPAGSTSLHLVVNERGQFLEENFQQALAILGPATAADGAALENQPKKNPNKMATDTMHIVQVIMERNYDPVIVFAFSKRNCENLAMKITTDYNSKEEREMVATIFNNAIDTLSDDDKKLPQVESILPMLQRGVGIHHSGLLPLLKEVIELLFQEGLIKCLFATETFSIGLNMPAKTVVFTSVKKWDGNNFRWISGGEYIQMSGRAGRRGLDDRGIVVMMVDDKMEPSVAKAMVKGSADTLNSSFHIGYSMLLNTIRVEGLDPEHMLRSSFHQFQQGHQIPKLRNEMVALEEKAAQIHVDNEEAIADYYAMKTQISLFKKQIQEVMVKPENILPFLIAGRLVHIVDGSTDWGWGVVLNYQYRAGSDDASRTKKGEPDPTKYIVDVLLFCAPLKPGEKRANTVPVPAKKDDPKGEPLVIPVLLSLIQEISQIKLNLPKDLRSEESRKNAWKSVVETLRRFPNGPLLLDPVEDMEITDETFQAVVQKTTAAEERLKAHALYTRDQDPNDQTFKKDLETYSNKVGLLDSARALKKKIRTFDGVILKDELKSMKRVLRRLGYTTSENIIEIKGRVACEINAGDEIVITELIFAGFFNTLTTAQIAAMLSCFVFQEKSDTNLKLSEPVSTPYQQLVEVARRVGEVQKECKMNTDVDDYVNQFKPGLAEVTYAWANGASFLEVCKLTSVFEGSIIRAMRRLEELLRQLVSASKSIGNTELENKFAETIAAIKRDIVFAASLYL